MHWTPADARGLIPLCNCGLTIGGLVNVKAIVRIARRGGFPSGAWCFAAAAALVLIQATLAPLSGILFSPAAASSTRPALVLPEASKAPKEPSTPSPSWAEAPRIDPLGAPGDTIAIPGLEGKTLVRIAEQIDCPVPAGLSDARDRLPVDLLTCIDRALGIGLASLKDKRRASLLQGVAETIEWQDELAAESGTRQPFIPPYRTRFGRVSAIFTSNVYQRIGSCDNAVVSWRLPDVMLGRISQDNIAAGRTAPLSAYLFRQRDIHAMIASSPAKIRSKNLPHAVCTAGRPETVEIHVDMGKQRLATFSVPAADFFQGGTAWDAHTGKLSREVTQAANDRIREGGGRVFATAKRFRETYGDFRNMRLMTALIDGTYRPKDFLPAHQLAVRRMFVRYHVLYSRHCYDDPQDGLTRDERIKLLTDQIFLTRTFVYTTRNSRTGEDVKDPEQFHIRERYADRVYDLAHEELNRTHNDLFLEQGIETWAKARHDIDLFFERQGCLSPRTASFEKNLFRAASLKWDPQRERGTQPQIFLPGINLK